jgi:glycosyltransferase involved in cell wall biosynthesis
VTAPAAFETASGLSIVLPAYNEAASIGQAVRAALVAGEKVAARYEVIVIDDGSSDGTSKEVEALIARYHPRVRLLKHEANRGYGAALRTGFEHSRYGLVFFTDSDNQFDVSELEQFMPQTAGYDMVVGFRTNRCDPLQRSLYSWLYNALVGLLFQIDVRDVNCAFKLMRREVVEQVTIECDNFFVNTELLAKARRLGFSIVERGVRHFPRTAGETSVKLSDVPRTLATVVTMWRRIKRMDLAPKSDVRGAEIGVPSAVEVVPVSRLS